MRAILLYSLLLSLALPSRAQQYYFARYTPRNGLVNNRVRALYQDSRGRLYFATYGGLSVYDGARFINYTTGDGLSTGLVNDIVEMGDDSIWVIPNTRVIHCLVHGILRDVATADHFYPITNQLIRCSDGFFYAIGDDGLFRFEHNRFVRIPLKDSRGNEMGKYLNQVIESHHRLLIVNDPNLENIVHSASLLVYDLATGKCSISADTSAIYSVIESPTHDILVGTARGVHRLDTLALRRGIIRQLPPPDIYAAAAKLIGSYLYFDHAGNFWLSAPDGVVRFGKNGDRQTFAPSNGLPAGAVNFILQDRENNMWFANEQNGVVKLVGQQVQLYSPIRPDFVVTDLFAGGSGDSVWIFDRQHESLLLVEGENQKLFRASRPLPPNSFIAIGKRAYLIAGRDIYALHFESDRFRTERVWHDSIRLDARVFFDRDGDLVLPTTCLTIFTGSGVLRYPLPDLADQADVDRRNHIWCVTRTNELFEFRIDNTAGASSLRLVHRFGKGAILPWSPRSLAIDSAGEIWIGTRDHGVYCMAEKGDSLVFRRQLTMQDGLSENFISYLACDPHGNLWACTPTGLDRVRIRDGRTMIDNITLSSDRYDAVYKLVSTGRNIHWALARGGVMKISPLAEDGSGYSPGLLFTRVQVGDELVPVGGPTPGLTLPYNRNTLSFLVGAPTFINEGLTRYSWLLEGSRDPKWSAPSPRSDIGFVNLPPGKYTLHVKAQFLTGRYPDKTAAYSFLILPPWWQTWWFRIAFVLACTAIIAFLIRHYLRGKLEIERTRLEKKRAVEKERTRIATDMHDDLGAGLSRIKFLSETIHLKKQMGQPVREEDLGNIGRYANEMIDKMGEIVWALNEKNDSLNDLLSYTRSYAAEYLSESGIPCTLDAPPENGVSRFVSGEFRRNVYLTIKEALHNIVKHSKAQNVTIRMMVTSELTIVIEDDGVGFDPAGPAGNGLNNMRHRITDIGGQLQIRGSGGTVIRLNVPLPD
ncbi:MAG TPA: two-component regulator propeller domain-containing protein [Puia sp.]|nr:two-component regulator propeller domain-containing protein [Puia sp.]